MLNNSHPWIFVSHASADLATLRQVRNYLEDRGASPLLFHMLSQPRPSKFWPLIRSEIKARNFFLYCESHQAEESPWVRKERAFVSKVGAKRKIRIGKVSVERGLDSQALDDFLRATRAFCIFSTYDQSAVRPYMDALRAADFQVFDTSRDAGTGESWIVQGAEALESYAKNGWIVVFKSAASVRSRFVTNEVAAAIALNARIVVVQLDAGFHEFANLRTYQVIDHALDANAPTSLVRLLLTDPA